MMKSLKIRKASYSVFSNSVFISMETETAAWSLLQGGNYCWSSGSAPARARAAPGDGSALAPDGKLKKKENALGRE